MGFVNERHWELDNSNRVAIDHERNIRLELTSCSIPGTVEGVLRLHWHGQTIFINADLFPQRVVKIPEVEFPKQDFLWRIKVIKTPQGFPEGREKIREIITEALNRFGVDGYEERVNQLEIKIDPEAFDRHFTLGFDIRAIDKESEG